MHTEAEADALRELGNVAFSHAGTALSGIVGRRVDISLPSVRVTPASEVEGGLADPEAPFYIITLRLLGDEQGVLALVFGEREALTLVEMLEGAPAGSRTSLSPTAEGVLAEVGNIMCGSALLAMYRFLKVSLIHSVPIVQVRTPPQRRPFGISPWEGDFAITVDAEFAVGETVAHGKMIISFADLQFFLDALDAYLQGGSPS